MRLISLCDDQQRVFIIKFIVIIAIGHCYYYNSLPGISVNICYYAGKKNQGNPGKCLLKLSSPVSTCDISGFTKDIL